MCTHFPVQADVIFALAKGNWRCGNPRCRRRLNPWAAPNDVATCCIARVDNYQYHDGMRGPTAAENNIHAEMCCRMCANNGER